MKTIPGSTRRESTTGKRQHFQGIRQAITDAIAGQVHIVCDNAISILPHIRTGRLRALRVTTMKGATYDER